MPEFKLHAKNLLDHLLKMDTYSDGNED